MRVVTKKLVNRILDHPRLVLGILAFITVIMGAFATQIKFNFTIEQLFSHHDPLVDRFLRFREEFSGIDNVIMLIYDCDDPFSHENLVRNRDMVDAFSEIDGVTSVKSISNLELFTAGGEYLLKPVFDDIPCSPDSLAMARKQIMSSPLVRNYLISDDGKTAAIIVEIDRDRNYHKERKRILKEIDDKQQQVPWTWHQAGLPVIRTRYVEYMVSDNIRFILPVVGIIILFLVLLFRSWVGVLLPIITVTMADIWTLGFMAALGININIVSYLIPTLLFIVGIGDSIHFLVKYYGSLQKIGRRREALFQSIKKIGTAIFLTSLTTAAGFGALGSVNIQIVQEFGWVTAVGVFFAFIISVLFIPTILLVLKPTPRSKLESYSRGFRIRVVKKIIQLVRNHPKGIIVSGVLITLVSIVGALQMNPHSKLLEDLRPGDKLLDDMRVAERRMGAVLPIEIIVNVEDSPVFPDIQDPVVLKFVDSLETFLQSIPEVGKTASVVDYLKEIHQAMNDGDPSFYRLPERRELIAQYMLLYEGEFETLINVDYSKVRIAAQIQDVDSQRSTEMENEISAFINRHAPPGMKVEVTGTAFLALRTNNYLIRNLFNSFIIAFIVITVVMIILFRSIKIAMLSILPNVIPMVIMAAVVGYFKIPLRASTAMTFAIAFGIAVDDTLHYLTRYRMELSEAHQHYRQANDATLLSTGVAIMSTTGILVAGYLVMTFSKFVPTIQFGLLSAITILTALIADLIFLPALLSLIRPNIKYGNE